MKARAAALAAALCTATTDPDLTGVIAADGDPSVRAGVRAYGSPAMGALRMGVPALRCACSALDPYERALIAQDIRCLNTRSTAPTSSERS